MFVLVRADGDQLRLLAGRAHWMFLMRSASPPGPRRAEPLAQWRRLSG